MTSPGVAQASSFSRLSHRRRNLAQKYFNIQNAKLAIKTWRACRLKQSATGCSSSCKNNKPGSRRRRSRANTLEATWARTAAAASAPAPAPWLAFRLLPFCVTEIVKKKMKKQKQKRKNSIQEEGKESARIKKLVTFSWFVCRLPNQSSDNNNTPGMGEEREEPIATLKRNTISLKPK